MSVDPYRGSLRGWLWFVRKFGVQKAWWYWRLGRRHGWIKTNEEAQAFADWYVATHSKPREPKSGL